MTSIWKYLEISTPFAGPNYWSGYWKKLIIMRLDIGDYEEKPTDKIEGFYERMTEVMPSLETHGCSYQEEGGFLRRVEEGTWAGHVDRAFCSGTADARRNGYGLWPDTRDRRKGNLQRCFQLSSKKRSAGLPAGRPSSCGSISRKDRPLDEIKRELADEIQEMREIREDVRFGPSTGSLVEEAENRDIPYIRLNEQSLVQLGYGVHQKRIQATTTVNTNMIAVDIAGE